MKEIVIVLRRNLFIKLLSSNKKDLEIICSIANKVVSHSDSILFHLENMKWIEWEGDIYINLMNLISTLDSLNVEEDFHFLEWNSDLDHNEEFGIYFSNPWKTNLENKYQKLDSEKNFDLKIFF